MKTKSAVKKYHFIVKRIKELEKEKNDLNVQLKKELPDGESYWGAFKACKTFVEEHTVPAYVQPSHYKLTVNHL